MKRPLRGRPDAHTLGIMGADQKDKPPDQRRANEAANDPAQRGHSGTGSGSALKRLKQWERMRAALRFKSRDKPSPNGGPPDDPPKR